jgi:hypothetical protein
LTTAWGVETINEDEGYEMKYSGDKSDKNSIDGVDVRTNGRYMTFYQTGLLNGSLQWERYVNDKRMRIGVRGMAKLKNLLSTLVSHATGI